MMFRGEHAPPHFHVRYQGQLSSFQIDPVRRLRGQLPMPQERLVIQWARLHQAELMENWERTMVHEELVEIDPLD